MKPDKGTVGTVRLNLSEYVEESEVYSRRKSVGAVGASRVVGGLENAKEKITHGLHSSHGMSRHRRTGSNKSYSSTGDVGPGEIPVAIDEQNELPDDPGVEEGIIRRYLMHDCKINSTLKIGILMVQVDGDRNYSAPPLRSAPMFGSIAGIVGDKESYSMPVPERRSTESALAASLGETASFSVMGSHDATELVDMYRRALAASYSCMPGELPADECIEDIFMGGDGTGSALYPTTYTTGVPSTERFDKSPSRHDHRRALRDDDSNTSARTSGSGSPSDDFNSATLRPSEARRARSHMRQHSGGSDKSAMTVTNIWGRNNGSNDNGPGLGIPSGSYGHSSRHRGAANRYPTSIPSAPTRGSGLVDHNAMITGQNESILRSIGLRGQRGNQDDNSAGGISNNSSPGATGQRNTSMGSLLSQHSQGPHQNQLNNRHNRHRSRECSEEDMREDLVAWKLPGAVK